jgi:hypothetical protein
MRMMKITDRDGIWLLDNFKNKEFQLKLWFYKLFGCLFKIYLKLFLNFEFSNG